MPISENTSERTSIPVVARRIPPCADPLLSTYGPGGNLDDSGLPDDVEVLAVDHLAVVFRDTGPSVSSRKALTSGTAISSGGIWPPIKIKRFFGPRISRKSGSPVDSG